MHAQLEAACAPRRNRLPYGLVVLQHWLSANVGSLAWPSRAKLPAAVLRTFNTSHSRANAALANTAVHCHLLPVLAKTLRLSEHVWVPECQMLWPFA
jgi:hypothetical protein